MTAGLVLAQTQQHQALAAPESIGILRAQTAATLADWGVPGCAEYAVLVCSELATNALRHGRIATLTVDLELADGRLTLSVPDANPDPPLLDTWENDVSEDGRGLVLVVTLADAWGFRADRDGKTVFAEFDLTTTDLCPLGGRSLCTT